MYTKISMVKTSWLSIGWINQALWDQPSQLLQRRGFELRPSKTRVGQRTIVFVTKAGKMEVRPKKIQNWTFSSELDRNWIKFFDLRWQKWKKNSQRRLEKSKSRDCFACCLIGAKIWLERLSSNVKALTWTRKLINRSLNFSSNDLPVARDHKV